MVIKVYVSPAMAIRAGKSWSGICGVEIDAAAIETLTTDEREWMAQLVASASSIGPLAEPTPGLTTTKTIIPGLLRGRSSVRS